MRNRSDFANLESQVRPLGFDGLRSELDASLGFASVAATEYETGNYEAAEHSHAAAQKLFRAVVGFISEGRELSVEQKQELDLQLAKVRLALARLKEFARRLHSQAAER